MLLSWLALVACRGDGVEDTPSPPPPPSPGVPGPLAFDGDPPRNVLMVSIDTLRRDHLTRYGGADWTPTLDALADAGVVLDAHRQCASWTLPGTTCTLGGRDPADMGVLMALDGETVVPGDTPLLATWLQASGWQTALVSSNLWLSVERGNAQGYEVAELLGAEGQASADVFDRALELTRAHDASRPWLTHLHLIDPHAPYDPPEDYLSELDALDPIPWDLTQGTGHYRSLGDYPTLPPDEQALLEAHMRVRYAAEVRWTDDAIRAGLAAFEADGWLDDTLVVIWSDHGEGFWEHGAQGHAHLLHPEETAAVAIFSAPNIVPESVDSPTHATDLVPTVLTVLGLPVPEMVTGLPLGQRESNDPRFAHVLARDGGHSSVNADGWSLHAAWDDGTLRLYDQTSDPDEADDLFGVAHPEVQRLWALLQPAIEHMSGLDPEIEVVWP